MGAHRWSDEAQKEPDAGLNDEGYNCFDYVPEGMVISDETLIAKIN